MMIKPSTNTCTTIHSLNSYTYLFKITGQIQHFTTPTVNSVYIFKGQIQHVTTPTVNSVYTFKGQIQHVTTSTVNSVYIFKGQIQHVTAPNSQPYLHTQS